MPLLEIYWSFRSPYSWLATDRLAAIAGAFPVELRFRFVRPLALREPNFFEENRPQWLPYLMKDVFRESQRLGVPIFPPRPDPIQMDLATGKVDAVQPYMGRLMDLGVAAEETERSGLRLARAMARRIWGGVENWHYDLTLAEAAMEAGLELSALERWIKDNRDRIGAVIADNEAEQMKHHWGVPLMVLDGEPFFGQDRLDSLVWRLNQIAIKG